MLKKILALSIAAAVIPQAASAALIVTPTMSFEGVADSTPLAGLGIYNDAAHFHTTFSGGGTVLRSVDIGGSGAFPGKPSPDFPDPHPTAVTTTATSIALLVGDAGGATELTFSYSALAAFSLFVDGSTVGITIPKFGNVGCGDSPFTGGPYNLCDWTTLTFKFGSAAHSFAFSGATGQQLLDDFILRRPDVAASGVPEPATFGLLALGLAASVASRRRKPPHTRAA